MASLPPLRRILPEDTPGADTWWQRVPYILNTFMQSLYSALNGNLTFSQNFACQIQTVTFTTAADYTSNNFTPLTFKATMTTKATGLLITSASNTTVNGVHTVIYGSPFADWQSLGNGLIQINNISGLANSSSYSVTFLLF